MPLVLFPFFLLWGSVLEFFFWHTTHLAYVFHMALEIPGPVNLNSWLMGLFHSEWPHANAS